jgi:hypothetical protein
VTTKLYTKHGKAEVKEIEDYHFTAIEESNFDSIKIILYDKYDSTSVFAYQDAV